MSVDPTLLLSGIQDRATRTQALETLRRDHQEWPRIWGEWFLKEDHPAALSAMVQGLLEAGHSTHAEAAVETVFRNHLRYPAQTVWACEQMVDPDCPPPLQTRISASALELILDALSRKEFAPMRARAKALLDGGQLAIRLMLEHATPQQASRFAHRVVRVDGIEPQRLRRVERAAAQRQTAPGEPEEPVLVATRKAVEARQAELKHLVEVEIPKTLKRINTAAAEGDLRENFEYHAQRARQELQSAQAAKLQRELAVVRIIEPGSADTSRVNIGTVVHLEGLAGEEVAPVTILGPWDSSVERRVFSAGAEVAQKLLGCQVGDKVEVDGAHARITAITSWSD